MNCCIWSAQNVIITSSDKGKDVGHMPSFKMLRAKAELILKGYKQTVHGVSLLMSFVRHHTMLMITQPAEVAAQIVIYREKIQKKYQKGHSLVCNIMYSQCLNIVYNSSGNIPTFAQWLLGLTTQDVPVPVCCHVRAVQKYNIQW